MNETAHLALLRGINVGGKNLLPMRSLTALAEACGAKDVRTHIQSGNVLFRAATSTAVAFCNQLSAAIDQAHALRVPVQTRSLTQMEEIVAANPFVAEDCDPKLLNVVFLSASPTPAQIAQLVPQRSPPDRFAIVGSTLYLHVPNGMGRTNITNAWLDSRLGCVSTVRNWTVTQALLDLMRAM